MVFGYSGKYAPSDTPVFPLSKREWHYLIKWTHFGSEWSLWGGSIDDDDISPDKKNNHLLFELGNDISSFIRLYERRIMQVEELKKQLKIDDYSHAHPVHIPINLKELSQHFEISKKDKSHNTNALFIKQVQIAKIIIEKKIVSKPTELSSKKYGLAASYMALAANIWVFQGQQLINRVSLPGEDKITSIDADLYFYILSFLAKCSFDDSKLIFKLANEGLRDSFKYHQERIFTLFSEKKDDNKAYSEANERCLMRTSYLN